MKSILALTLSLISLTAFAAQEKSCLSHGQCQTTLPKTEVACFKVISGEDYAGTPTCRIMCRHLPVTSYCYKESPSSISGICKNEIFSEITLNPEDPKCEEAISPEEFGI